VAINENLFFCKNVFIGTAEDSVKLSLLWAAIISELEKTCHTNTIENGIDIEYNGHKQNRPCHDQKIEVRSE